MTERVDAMAHEMEETRAVARDVIYRVVVLSATIVAFSATLLSVETLDLSVDESLLKLSWFFFGAVVLIGPISVMLESRAKYVVAWRSIQAQDFEQRSPTIGERLRLLSVLLYSVLIRPRNLILVRDTDYGDKQKAWLNARLIQRLHVVWDFALALELIFWTAFSSAVILLIVALT